LVLLRLLLLLLLLSGLVERLELYWWYEWIGLGRMSLVV
jgi:hypothetical protein